LNPELRFEILPGENYPIRMPKGSGELLLVKIDKIPTFNIPKEVFVRHRVRSGETLSIIAQRYRTSVSRIMIANHIQKSNYIVAGEILKIPQTGHVGRKLKAGKDTHNSSQGLKHIVRKGESLWVIAKNYGTSINKIKMLNHMTSSSLYAGQVLKIF